MSKSLNRVELIGHLGQDPETKEVGGSKLARLSVATERSWANSDGNEETRTEWHTVVAWEGLAGVCSRYLSKGDRIYVDGRLQYRTWTGDDGRERTTTEVRADNLIMLGNSGGSSKPSRDDKRVQGATASDSDLSGFSDDALMGDDGLPF